MISLEKIAKKIGKLAVLGTALVLANPDYTDAKVTQIEKRRDGTIVRIYDDEAIEGIRNEGRQGAYLYPIRYCNECGKTHSDENRRKVELQFQTKSGRIVDYLPKGRNLPDSEIKFPPPSKFSIYSDKLKIKKIETDYGTLYPVKKVNGKFYPDNNRDSFYEDYTIKAYGLYRTEKGEIYDLGTQKTE